MSFRRLESFLIFDSEPVSGSSVRRLRHLRLQLYGAQQLVNRLCPHPGFELVAVLLDGLQISLVRKQLTSLELSHTRVDDHERLEVEDPLDIPQRHIQQQTHARRQGLQIPDVRHRARELDVTHAVAADFGQGYLHPALLANHAPMLQTLVLATQAFVILDRAEDLGAEQTVALRLEGTVVDGLGLFHLPV